MTRHQQRFVAATLLAVSTSLCAAQSAPAPAASNSAVTVTEQQVTIPTYLVGPPDPNPQFYTGTQSQGAQHRIYPYPMYDNLTAEKADKTYNLVYLENQYLKVGILPELGGKIFEAVDKTNGYHFFYHQDVIKPALISLLGAWISGGVEWDLPHHHRATSFLPVQYTTESSPDGSKTVWVGELELRDRMRWAVGITLHPGKSYVEASFRMINRTPLPVSMLCFSNVAVSANVNYQVIFPPDTQYVTYHTKNQFTSWPVTDSPFQSFRVGDDASWWKNHTNSISMFAWNYTDDFMAGYDHGKQAGTMAIADHNVVPGKKFFTWGNGPGGQNEDRQLTDAAGPYIELMVGAYSDNQPDYTWLAPFETRAWTQYWYPFRDIDGVKNANTDAAVNVTVANNVAKVGFYCTSDRPNATVTVKLKDQTLLSEKIAINPGKSYTKDIPLPAGADEHDLRASLSDGGNELVAYSPIRLAKEPKPTPFTPYGPPAQVKTNEELYLAGLRADQFRSPSVNPETYWQEALTRDPGDVRVNTAEGIEAIRGGRYADAEKYLRKALERATDKFTTPKDGEPFYYLGLALKAQGKNEEAFDQFSKATWSAAWKGPAYFEMAEVASIQGNRAAAQGYLEQSLSANSQNTRAINLAAAFSREAQSPSDRPLFFRATEHLDRLDLFWQFDETLDFKSDPSNQVGGPPGGSAVFERIRETLRMFPATGLELAADFMNAGRWKDGTAILHLMESSSGRLQTSPLVYYYLGYFAQKLNQPDLATDYFVRAANAPTDFAFPFQMEMIPVLEAAMKANPKDSHAPYLLGNLLYDTQPQRAVALWKQSADLGADFPVVYRNLAWNNTRGADASALRDKTLALLEKAESFGGNAMVLNDLDRLYEENGLSPEKRLATIDKDPALINRDDITTRAINLYIFEGKYDPAITLLKMRFYRAWEGGGAGAGRVMGDSWANANILKGQSQLAARQYPEAIASFQAALVVPGNLAEAGSSSANRSVEVNYWLGNVYDAKGDKTQAQQAWSLAAAGTPAAPAAPAGRAGGRGGRAAGPPAAGLHLAAADSYFQALALIKLGQADKAKPLFQQLLDAGTQALSSNPAEPDPLPAVVAPATRAIYADAHYLAALGHLGLGDKDKARQDLTAALHISPDHLAAKVAMNDIAR